MLLFPLNGQTRHKERERKKSKGSEKKGNMLFYCNTCTCMYNTSEQLIFWEEVKAQSAKKPAIIKTRRKQNLFTGGNTRAVQFHKLAANSKLVIETHSYVNLNFEILSKMVAVGENFGKLVINFLVQNSK